MDVPLFIATRRFDNTNGAVWENYLKLARLPNLKEVAGLDAALCRVVIDEPSDEDWHQMAKEHRDFFPDLDYVLRRTREVPDLNILGVYRNPSQYPTLPPGPETFEFLGYDLIDDETQVSALTGCDGFEGVLEPTEVNQYGLITSSTRATELKSLLARNFPNEPHAQCELYAIWRLNEGKQTNLEKSD